MTFSWSLFAKGQRTLLSQSRGIVGDTQERTEKNDKWTTPFWRNATDSFNDCNAGYSDYTGQGLSEKIMKIDQDSLMKKTGKKRFMEKQPTTNNPSIYKQKWKNLFTSPTVPQNHTPPHKTTGRWGRGGAAQEEFVGGGGGGPPSGQPGSMWPASPEQS